MTETILTPEPAPAAAAAPTDALPKDVESAFDKIKAAGADLEVKTQTAEAWAIAAEERALAAERRALAFWSRNELWICIGLAAVLSFLLGYFSPHPALHR